MSKKQRVAVGFSALLVMWAVHFTTNHIRQFGSIKGHTVPSTEGPSALVRALRPNFPYSIIAGGAYSTAELRFAHGSDKVVRAHYADFNIQQAKLVTLTDDRYQYVSYRLNNQVYWTKKKLRIPKGELLLTDGENYARARCGNRLSEKRYNAISLNEPDSALLSLPPMSADLLPKLALADPPTLGDLPAGSFRPIESRTGADVQSEANPFPAVAQPLTPVQPVWGGQPVLGGSPPVIPTTPTVPVGSRPSTTHTSLPPVTPPPNGGTPPPMVPVPEPGTIDLFVLTLGISIWALLRITPKDES